MNVLKTDVTRAEASNRRLDVIVLHPAKTAAGGIVNATLFHALSLQSVGLSVEIWTGSHAVAARAEKLGIECFYSSSLASAGMCLVSLDIFKRALSARRRGIRAILSEGAKLWLHSKLLFPNAAQAVVFHNRSVGGRKRYPIWIAISRRHQTELQKLAISKGLDRQVKYVPNGPMPTAESKLSARTVRDTDDKNGFTFGSASNFAQKKNIPLLIHAFSIVLAQNSNAHLVLAGDGVDRAKCESAVLKHGVEGHVTWLGWIDNMIDFYRKIDVFCLPSDDEPFGLVVVEAMQAGLPVIATNTFGPSDVIEVGKTGFIVPIGDENHFADAMINMLRNPSFAKNMGINGQQIVASSFVPEVIGSRLASALGFSIET